MLATAADGTVWMAWQAWRDGQADIVLAPLGKRRQARRRVHQGQRRPGQRMVAQHRRRPERPRPRRLRQLRGRQLRRDPAHPRAPTARSHSRSPSPARPAFEARPSLAAEPAAGSGSPTRNGRPTGARTPSTCSTARDRASIAQPRSWSPASTAGASCALPTRSSVAPEAAEAA